MVAVENQGYGNGHRYKPDNKEDKARSKIWALLTEFSRRTDRAFLFSDCLFKIRNAARNERKRAQAPEREPKMVVPGEYTRS